VSECVSDRKGAAPPPATPAKEESTFTFSEGNYSLTHLHTYTLTHSHTYTLTLTYSHTHLLTDSFTHTHLLTHAFTH
jgi:hypothetical protein